jgi:ketosteroid isomerase-like protein
MGETEEVIQEAYEAFRARDVDRVLSLWNAEGELKPVPHGRVYRGHDELRSFLERDVYEGAEFDFRVYTVLEQAEYALVFGRYSVRENGNVVDHGIFWIAHVSEGKLTLYEAFETVGDAMAVFKQRLGARRQR